MHELGVICEVVNTVEKIAKENNVKRVSKIVLEVGELSGMVPEYIQDCFPAATYKTSLEGVELGLDIIPGIAKCRDCGKEFNAKECDLKCPVCGGQNLEALSGREFIIKEILVED